MCQPMPVEFGRVVPQRPELVGQCTIPDSTFNPPRCPSRFGVHFVRTLQLWLVNFLRREDGPTSVCRHAGADYRRLHRRDSAIGTNA
jgi:hypothetical protein